MSVISISDLPAKVRDAVEPNVLQLMIDGVNARAVRIAPCLSEGAAEMIAEAKLILVGVVQRWSEAGAGALTQTQQTAGPFSVNQSFDTRSRTGFGLWPSEITALQDLCRSHTTHAAFGIDTSPLDDTSSTGARRVGKYWTSQVSGRRYWSGELGYLDVERP